MKTDYLYLDAFGILRFELGGKVLLLFITEIVTIWLSFMILSSWDVFRKSPQGKSILGLNIFFLLSTFNSIILKKIIFGVFKSEILKQFGIFCLFSLVFLVLYYYRIEDFKEDNKVIQYYFNPVGMTYVFLLVFLTCFYIIYNSQK